MQTKKHNTKNKSGISFVVLVASIIMMLILISTIIVSYNNINDKTEKLEFAKEMYLVENSIEQYKFLNGEYPLLNSYPVDLDNIDSTSKGQFSGEPGYDTNTISLKPVDYYEANITTIKRGSQTNDPTDIYLYSETNKRVYYLKGLTIGNNTYYTLTDELMQLLNINKVD